MKTTIVENYRAARRARPLAVETRKLNSITTEMRLWFGAARPKTPWIITYHFHRTCACSQTNRAASLIWCLAAKRRSDTDFSIPWRPKTIRSVSSIDLVRRIYVDCPGGHSRVLGVIWALNASPLTWGGARHFVIPMVSFVPTPLCNLIVLPQKFLKMDNNISILII